ncbi:HXXEE domain-containing protein [Paracoccaceae bacterium GXU_MW_L88]
MRERWQWDLIALLAAIILHNLEEILRLPHWSVDQGRALILSPAAFTAAVFATTLLVITVGIRALLGSQSSRNFMQSVALVMIANVFVPHLALSIYTQSFAPGLLTSLCLVAPAGLLFLRHRAIFSCGIMSRESALWAAVYVIAVFTFLALAALLINSAHG